MNALYQGTDVFSHFVPPKIAATRELEANVLVVRGAWAALTAAELTKPSTLA
jgi:hypothetical protein